MFRNVGLAFGTILENRHKRRHQYVYTIKRTLHVSPKIGILGADPGFLLGGGAPLRNDVTDR